MNLPSSRLFRACPACNGRGVGPLRELVGERSEPWMLRAPEWVPVRCSSCRGRGWVRA